MAKEIKGIVVPVVTPFHADESINESALRKIVNYLVDNGVHGLFPSGSQGELFALSTDEKKRVMDVVIEENNGRAFVMPSTGAVTTRESIELTKHAEKSGADAVSVITPYFISPSADELRDHYIRISESVSRFDGFGHPTELEHQSRDRAPPRVEFDAPGRTSDRRSSAIHA